MSLPHDVKDIPIKSPRSAPSDIPPSAKRLSHPFRMWDSIAQTPEAVRRCLDCGASEKAIAAGKALLERNIERVFLVGCGTSHHAAMSTAYALYDLTDVDADACNAFEFTSYRLSNVCEKTGVIVFSHSGSTGTTVQALRAACERGAFTISFTHAPDSPLAHGADIAITIDGGIEPLYPKTRSYIETAAMGHLLATGMAAEKSSDRLPKSMAGEKAAHDRPRGIRPKDEEALVGELRRIPDLLDRCRPLEGQAKMLADKYAGFRRVLIVGAGPNYPTALEIALKFKEAVLIAGEGLEIEEAFHGPIVSLDSGTLVIAISVPGPGLERVGRFAHVASRMGASVLSVGPEPYEGEGIDTMRVPTEGIREAFSGSVLVYPLYMLSYYSALARGNNPDNFRLEELGLVPLVTGL